MYSSFLGGIIPEEDMSQLQEIGVTAVFGPGSSIDDIVTLVQESVAGG